MFKKYFQVGTCESFCRGHPFVPRCRPLEVETFSKILCDWGPSLSFGDEQLICDCSFGFLSSLGPSVHLVSNVSRQCYIKEFACLTLISTFIFIFPLAQSSAFDAPYIPLQVFKRRIHFQISYVILAKDL